MGAHGAKGGTMASTSKSIKRYDTNGRALHTGERQRKTGTYEYKYKDAGGEWRRISAKTLDDLREKEKTVTLDTLQGLSSSRYRVTLDSIYEQWRRAKTGLRGNVLSNYNYMYQHFISPALGKRPIDSIKTSDVKIFYRALVDGGMEVSTVDGLHTVLHQVLDLAFRDDLIRRNPADHCMADLKRDKQNRTKPGRQIVALTPEQQRRLESFLLEYDNGKFAGWYPIFMTMMSTGLRVGEATALQWSDIDFDARTISVDKTLVYFADDTASDGKRHQTYEMHPVPKTNAGVRTIPLTALAHTALKMQYDQTRAHGKTCRSAIDGYDDFVFVNRYGLVFHQGPLNRALRDRIIPQANADAEEHHLVMLPHFSCHSLRHTYCSNLCRAGVSLKQIQTLMGHNDIHVTLDIYTSVTGQDLREGTDRLEEYLRTH